MIYLNPDNLKRGPGSGPIDIHIGLLPETLALLKTLGVPISNRGHRGRAGAFVDLSTRVVAILLTCDRGNIEDLAYDLQRVLGRDRDGPLNLVRLARSLRVLASSLEDEAAGLANALVTKA